MKTSLIITVLNEESSIEKFLNSVLIQSTLPLELVIVDGGSKDSTLKRVEKFRDLSLAKLSIRLYTKKGNRAVGRNEAIRKAKGDIILITDAGCILDKDWVKNISKPFLGRTVDVVAGYYAAKTQTVFQKCLVPYVLVMPDRVKATDFLPATRSMALRKSVWQKMGGFEEMFSHNEDYVFAQKLRKASQKIVFAKDAIVYWIPRNTFREAYTMFRRFAFGDIESGIVRDKVLLIFARYLLFLYLIAYAVVSNSTVLLLLIIFGVILYVVYSIQKNMRYVQDQGGYYLLPLLQITSDIAVMHGSLLGFLKIIRSHLTFRSFKQNKLTLIVVALYLLLLLPLLTWGIPNPNHPFFYHMDEWHGVQSIRYLFATGSSNVEGAAYGMLFFYFLSGLFLVPFTLIGFLDPFAITSSVGNLVMQERLASILRLSTLIWGVGSILLMTKIVRSQIKGNVLLALLLFIFNPLWLTLSTYFKYDISVIFWILLSVFFFFKYEQHPTRRNLIVASIVSALTITIKISAIPIFGMFILSFFLFTPKPLSRLKDLLVSILVFIFILLIFGTPDIATHSTDYYNLLHLNMVTIQGAEIYRIPSTAWNYLAFRQYPAIFGYFLYLSTIVSAIFIVCISISAYLKRRQILKKELLIIGGMILFIGSLVTLQGLGAGSNRALILLPFMILLISFAYTHLTKDLHSSLKRLLLIIFIVGMIIQVAQSFAWISLKYQSDPRSSSSEWLQKSIKGNTIVGIENIPIYQMLPDNVVKEFYTPSSTNRFRYEVIDAKSKILPNVVILSSADSVKDVMKYSPKIDLLERLKREGYTEAQTFSANFYFYDLVGSRLDFVLANLITMPTSITIYRR